MKQVVKLKPAVKSYLWGGSYFQKYGKSDLDVVSELWEVSFRGDDSSVIASGEEAGKKINEVASKEDLGPNVNKFPYFPCLVKLIDANDNLSVQVHPSDDYALKYEHSYGKSEMWHIISNEPGSGLYVGLNKDYAREEIEEALNNGNIINCLNFFEVKPGDTFIINPGTIHAIGKGVRLIEIQQNSNLTYRLFDYHRVDKNGNPRELHIKKALDVIDYRKYEVETRNNEYLADNQYFTVKEITFDNEIELIANDKSFISFTFLEGEGLVNDIPFNQYDTFFLPYGKSCLIKGKGKVVVSSVR